MDPKSIWDETFSVLREILGLTPKAAQGVPPLLKRPGLAQEGIALTPPSLPLHPDPIGRLGMEQRRLNRGKMGQPGAAAFDTRPIEELTDQEESVLSKVLSEQGRTYRPPVRVDLPPGVLIP